MNLKSIFSSSPSPFPSLTCRLTVVMTYSLDLIKTWWKACLTFGLALVLAQPFVPRCNPTSNIYLLSVCVSPGLWPCPDVQPVHAPFLVDGERAGVQGDAHHPSPILGTRGPPVYIYIWLPVGFPVHRGGSFLAADTPGCKYINSVNWFFVYLSVKKPIVPELQQPRPNAVCFETEQRVTKGNNQQRCRAAVTIGPLPTKRLMSCQSLWL